MLRTIVLLPLIVLVNHFRWQSGSGQAEKPETDLMDKDIHDAAAPMSGFGVQSNVSIIIYATYRGGSTYASEFFNRHQKIAFILEPLSASNKPGRSIASVPEVLEAVVRCEFRHDMVPALRQIDHNWFHEKMFCFLPDQTEGCEVVKQHPFHRSISTESATKHCRLKPYKAMTVVRISRLKDLERFMRRGVKVIHLVRDPRGTMIARETLDKPEDLHQLANPHHLCSNAVADLAFAKEAKRQQNLLISRNYYLVRYEDLARSPRREVAALYNFLGIKPDNSLLSWVQQQEDRNLIQYENKGDFKADFMGTFWTERQYPAFMSQAWRLKISMTRLRRIQAACSQFMEMTGYLPLDTEEALWDLKFPVLMDIDRGPFTENQES